MKTIDNQNFGEFAADVVTDHQFNIRTIGAATIPDSIEIPQNRVLPYRKVQMGFYWTTLAATNYCLGDLLFMLNGQVVLRWPASFGASSFATSSILNGRMFWPGATGQMNNGNTTGAMFYPLGTTGTIYLPAVKHLQITCDKIRFERIADVSGSDVSFVLASQSSNLPFPT